MEQTEWARLQLGQLYERYGKLKEAEDQYRICLATRENYPFALAALGELEIKKGKTAEGEKLLLQAADIIPEVGFYVEMAKLAQQTGRTEEAQKLVVQIQEMMQEDIAAGHNMSLEAARFHLEVSHDYDKALQFAGDELARRPDNKDVNQLCAALWLAKGDKTKAAEFLRKASITHSKDPELAELKKKLG
jgi:tetratricopeptide (TPR) repeat protein